VKGARSESRFEIEVARPFRLDFTVWTLRRRSQNTVDGWDGTRYLRTLVIDEVPVGITVRQESDAAGPLLIVEVEHPGMTPDELFISEIRSVLSRTLGLEVDLSGFYRLAEGEFRLATLAQQFVGMRPPCFPSVFEAAVNAIACQQLSLTVGIHLLNRLSKQFGLAPSAGEGAQAGFPTPDRLAGEDPQHLRDLGFSRSKAHAIITLSQQIVVGETDLEALRDAEDDRAMATLLDLTGIGRWSAEYVLLRGLGRLQVLPGDDVGARNNLHRRFGLAPSAGYEEVNRFSRRWSPYGGLVYFHLLLDTLAAAGHVAPEADTAVASCSDPTN
jgi:DNA-3-methyladenine glycosylase II